ncbi:MAG TPA: hypothetical protein VF665_17425 [Longimicrobium sp.]|jgi:hypothetical protein|uniref:hypothetical protein n=1 Tax=Longimicrobium sp. TaxID=2029185 RepID=UPI002EDB1C30
MHVRRSATLLAALVILPTAARAQLTTGPLFSSPVTQPKIDFIGGDAYGTGLGLTLAVRPFNGLPGLRFRASVADGRGTGAVEGPYRTRLRTGLDAVAYTAAVDYSAPIATSESGPLRASLVTGLGATLNNGTAITVPLGVSVGYNGTRVRPYITPRLMLEARSGSQVNNGEPGYPAEDVTNGITGAVDWGVDFVLPRGAILRTAVTTGNHHGFGVGISF